MAKYGNGFLTTENFKKLLELNPDVKKIRFYGADLFLNPNAEEILKLASHLDVEIYDVNPNSLISNLQSPISITYILDDESQDSDKINAVKSLGYPINFLVPDPQKFFPKNREELSELTGLKFMPFERDNFYSPNKTHPARTCNMNWEMPIVLWNGKNITCFYGVDDKSDCFKDSLKKIIKHHKIRRMLNGGRVCCDSRCVKCFWYLSDVFFK